MNFLNIRLKIRDFFKKNKKKIIIILIIWTGILALNYLLKNMPKQEIPKTTYTPNVSVMNEDEVPKKLQDPINEKIKEFMGYCNNKEYENAYNMLSKDCKDYLYPTIEDFKQYVNIKFSTKKAYSIQNYSNVGEQYVYSVKIFEDLMATGLTGKDYQFYDEKIVFDNRDNDLKLSIGGFIRKEDLNVVAEDDNMKVEIVNKIVTYEQEIYQVKITNKTGYTIVLADNSEKNEIILNIGDQNRSEKTAEASKHLLLPDGSKTFHFAFVKFFDDGRVPRYLKFNTIRILQSYTGSEQTRQEELDNAIKLYSMQIDL